MESFPNIALLSCGRFQAGEVTKDLLLAAGREVGPSLLCSRISIQFVAKPRRHWMARTAFIVVIECENDACDVTDGCTRGLANVPVQIEKEISVAHGHQIDAPGGAGFSVDLNAHRYGPTPIAFQPSRLISADEHVGIYPVDLYPGSKAQSHNGKAMSSSGSCGTIDDVCRMVNETHPA